jgi:UDP-glucose 4-epimerase
VRRPLDYYRNNTVNTRALLEAAVNGGIEHFIFSSTAAVYGNPDTTKITETSPTIPMSPYGSSKLMSETMLHDVAAAYDLRYAILRYFNVAGADPQQRTGQMTAGATHLVKVAIETALGQRAKLDVYGTNYPTPDGTCIRDYIHVSDLARAHSMSLAHLRRGGRSVTFNCGYGHGYSVLDVIESVKRVSGRNFAVVTAERRPGDPVAIVADSTKIQAALGWAPRFDDLDTIVAHALAFERHLASEGGIKRAVHG